VLRSTDGGETLEPEIVVARSDGLHHLITSAVDRSVAFKDRIYIVWGEKRGSRMRIVLSHSSDKGKTWSSPIVVDDARPRNDPTVPGPDLMLPVVGVNKDGVVGVSWYDKRDHADDRGWDLRFAASLDGGETLSPSVRVSSKSQTYTGHEAIAVGSSYHGQDKGSKDGLKIDLKTIFLDGPGDTNGMAVGVDGTFHPVWTDNRTGVPQIWSAPVDVRGRVARNGSADLATFADMSEKVSYSTSDVALDRTTGVITLHLRMKNASSDTIRGPLKLRLVGGEDDYGRIEARGAENGVDSIGAVWSVPMEGATLLPGAATRPLKITLILGTPRSVFNTKGEVQDLPVPVLRLLAPESPR
jgi:hypothetical protein